MIETMIRFLEHQGEQIAACSEKIEFDFSKFSPEVLLNGFLNYASSIALAGGISLETFFFLNGAKNSWQFGSQKAAWK
jgi:hypothetical protein